MRNKIHYALISFCLCCFFSSQTKAANTELVAAGSEPVNSTIAIANAEFSTLRVVRIGETYDSRFVAISSGSGFVVSPGIVLTNHHVIAESPEDYLYFKKIRFLVVPTALTTEKPRQGILIDQWEEGDMALLEVDGLRVSPLPLATEPQKNENVQAIGYPVNTDRLNHLTVDDMVEPQPAYITKGNIALFSDKNPNGAFIATVFHTAAIDGGNSGGPLIDDCGRVVGINTWSASTTVDDRGINTHPGQFISTKSTEIAHYLDGQKITYEAREGVCFAKTDQEIKAQDEINKKMEAQQKENEQKIQEERNKNNSLKLIILSIFTIILIVIGYYAALKLRNNNTNNNINNNIQNIEAANSNTIEIVKNDTFTKHKNFIMPIALGLLALIILFVIIRISKKSEQNKIDTAMNVLKCAPIISETIGDEPPSETEFVFDPNKVCVNGRTAYRKLADGSFQRVMFKTSKTTVALLTLSKDLNRFQRQTFKLTPAQAALMEAKKSAYGDVLCTPLGAPQRDATDAALDDIARAASEATKGDPVAKATWSCKPHNDGKITIKPL